MSAPLKTKFQPEHQGHWVAHGGGQVFGFDKNLRDLMKRFPKSYTWRQGGSVVSLTYVPVGFIA